MERKRHPSEISVGSSEIDPEFLSDDEFYNVDDWVALFLEEPTREMWDRMPEESQDIVNEMGMGF